MKFWQKIFIYSLILFLVAFNVAGLFLIKNTFNSNIKKEIEDVITQQDILIKDIGVSISSIKNLYNEEILKYNATEKILKNYSSYTKDYSSYLEFLDFNNDLIFSTFPYEIKYEREELKKLSLDKKQFIIRDINKRTYLFSTKLLNLENALFKCTYIKDITPIYDMKNYQYGFFFKLNIIFSTILGIGMYILSKLITKPINELIYFTKRISNGNYSERIVINSKDEIGILANNFNNMAISIEENIEKLNQKDYEKQMFINSLTHELKTPLTCIIGFSDFLKNKEYDKKVFTDALDYISSEGKRLERLSSKMMDLIFLTKDSFDMKNENIQTVLSEINVCIKEKLSRKNIKLHINSIDYEIKIEKDLIKNLILNLIDNAIKASEENTNIYLSAYKTLNFIIEIRDEGTGMTQTDIQRIFEPFYMADKCKTRSDNGFGMGMAICKEIANLHNAYFEIHSELNKGTTIKIIFK